MTDPKLFAGGGAPSEAARERGKALIGRVILNRYRIVELVAMGGIGGVYRAMRLSDGQDVALKVLHPDTEGLPELVSRFEREAVAGKHIMNPNVAAVYEFDRFDDGSYFLAEEFVRGITLRELIDRGPVPAARAARIARELASALGAAHDMGIVHRDVKPRNVMILDADDSVKLIDFGLAKVPVERLAIADDDARRSLTHAGVVFGTIAYMAPETALGMRALDKRADLYALGVILYEMLAGKHPFTATEPTALFAQQRTAVPPPIHERSPKVSVPARLEAVVHKLLAKEPDDRYRDARAAVAAFDAAAADEAKQSRQDATARDEATQAAVPGSRWTLPRWAPAAGAGALLLFSVIVIARCAGGSGAKAPEASTSEAPSESTAAMLPASTASTAPSTGPSAAASAGASAVELESAAGAGDAKRGVAAILTLVDAAPPAPLASSTARAAAARIAALLPAGEDANAVFDALSTRLGSGGLDVLEELASGHPTSPMTPRARDLLRSKETLARGTPALQIASELRQAPCGKKSLLFARAGTDGDERALAILEKLHAQSCNSRAGECCYRNNGTLETALAGLKARSGTLPE